MNRKARRAQQADQRAHRKTLDLPERLTLIPPEEMPIIPGAKKQPFAAYKSRRYLVQVYDEEKPQYPVLKRLSVCRVKLTAGGWEDGLTWDELQAIKSEIGYGHWYGIEIYPPDDRVINVANFRHIWISPHSFGVGW